MYEYIASNSKVVVKDQILYTNLTTVAGKTYIFKKWTKIIIFVSSAFIFLLNHNQSKELLKLILL